MCDFSESSQLHKWMFASLSQLEQCRAKGNLLAREFLSKPKNEDETVPTAFPALPPVQNFAGGYAARKTQEPADPTTLGPWNDPSNNPYLSPTEEELLVAFYASKLPSLIGPNAQVHRIRRESKVMATAAMFLRRFFLSNSVMIHDPKVLMVAAAFLATKVEDATADVRYLEDGTNLMNAPVSMAEILPAELTLMEGIQCDLLCFHPFKAVVALTEDLRTFLKSKEGIQLVQNKRIAGEDLKPLYDGARAILDDVIVSDLPLLFSPGQIGLAAMIVANEELQAKQSTDKKLPETVSSSNAADEDEGGLPPLDLLAYVRLRFSEERGNEMQEIMTNLLPLIKGLKEGKHGCGNHNVDMVKLKGVHKKLKKCKAWGKKEKKDKKEKKSKKRASVSGEEEPKSKKAKA